MKRVPTGEVKKRSRKLTLLFESFSPYQDLVGRVVKVWVTDVAADGIHLVGHTKSYVQVLLSSGEDLLGASVEVRVMSVGRWSVMGELILSKREPQTETVNSKAVNIQPCRTTEQQVISNGWETEQCEEDDCCNQTLSKQSSFQPTFQCRNGDCCNKPPDTHSLSGCSQPTAVITNPCNNARENNAQPSTLVQRSKVAPNGLAAEQLKGRLPENKQARSHRKPQALDRFILVFFLLSSIVFLGLLFQIVYSYWSH